MTSPTSPHNPDGSASEFGSGVDLRQADDRELDRWIDRLVDNEIAEAARRALLVELDRRPQGWRRCALAFLEAQAWRLGVGEVSEQCDEANDRSAMFASIFADDVPLRVVPSPSQGPSPANGQPSYGKTNNGRNSNGHNRISRVRIAGLSNEESSGPSSAVGRVKYFELTPQRPDKQKVDMGTEKETRPLPKPQTRNASRFLAAMRSPGGLVSTMAACFLLAFVLGLAINSGNNSPDKTTDGASNLQNQLAANEQGASQPDVKQQSPVNAQGNGSTALANDRSVSGSGTWGTVSLASNSSDPQSPPLEFPVVDGPSMTDWLSTLPPPVDSKTLAELRRTGHEVITETKWVTVRLQDGRFAIVPVDEVQVRYVGGNNVQ
mgnify:CR=1 FL=1